MGHNLSAGKDKRGFLRRHGRNFLQHDVLQPDTSGNTLGTEKHLGRAHVGVYG